MSNSKLTSMDEANSPPDFLRLSPSKSYALTGKVMLSAIVILFFVVFFMICLHLYTRWYLLRARRRHLQNRQLRRHRRTHLVFYVDPAPTRPTRGLDPSVLKSLPVFVYSSQTHPDSLECAVCLSEFQDKETGRLLSKCNHCFHTDCIDMWFHSHSTCPLCRSPVEPAPGPVNPPQIVVSITEEEGRAEPGSTDFESSSSSSAAVGTSATSFAARRKELELAVPGRNPSFGDESGCESPASQTSSFRSPMSRMLSFKKILSRERKSAVSPSGTELDIERGREQSQQTHS